MCLSIFYKMCYIVSQLSHWNLLSQCPLLGCSWEMQVLWNGHTVPCHPVNQGHTWLMFCLCQLLVVRWLYFPRPDGTWKYPVRMKLKQNYFTTLNMIKRLKHLLESCRGINWVLKWCEEIPGLLLQYRVVTFLSYGNNMWKFFVSMTCHLSTFLCVLRDFSMV